ncbi:ACP S-malonyltransferase [Eubacterium oxidoreducens]|uniref:Malonyl CoA-acyl carrier protein transacylase n=1 Tax=Eubacterium oxidoreducens TaxID=1732 RepID=A0A1G6BF85_EUBOX|nr:ACP S-malonyltransferase [Eubacterium oxidoreducens]SDB19280.1 [acyl-carrier-protein] S-malonyltransferase [Eubacterium oxidoreducens]
MSKLAFVFPGQGSQYTGMGKDFYDADESFRNVIESASEISGFDLEHILFENDERLNITKYTQIAMLAVEVAILKKLEKDGVKPDVSAGLSLGEYGAIVAAKAMSVEDAFHLVTRRGALMQEAVPTGGAMCAIMKLDAKEIEKVCEETEGLVNIANYNCPGQIVITGEQQAVEKAAEGCKNAGARKCTMLNVSGPFHSAMLEEAGVKLGEELANVTLHDLQIPYVTNVTADYVNDVAQIRPLLQKQISSSVLWQQSVERMIEDGVTTFVEIGPKKSLSKFLKKINPEVKSLNIDKLTDYEAVLEELL